MPKVDVKKCPDAIVAMKRLNRLCERLGVRKRLRSLSEHVSASKQRCIDKNAAEKREKRRQERLSLAFVLSRKNRKKKKTRRRA